MKKVILLFCFVFITLTASMSFYKNETTNVVIIEEIKEEIKKPANYLSIIRSMGYNPKQDHLALIISKSIELGVDHNLVLALVAEESRFKENVVNWNSNGSNDRGYFQLNSDWHNQYKNDIEGHINYGISYLKWCLKVEHGDEKRALSRYNSGSPIKKVGIAYAERVLEKKSYILRLL